MAAESDPVTEVHAGVGGQLAHGHGKSEREQPVAEDARETRQELNGPARADDLERTRSGRQLPVPPGVQQGRHVHDVVGVEVAQGEVRDRLPLDAQVGQTGCDTAAAVHQQPYRPGVEEVAALNSPGHGRRRAGSHGREAHQGPWKSAFLIDSTPAARSRTR